jgi:hypothetical protein
VQFAQDVGALSSEWEQLSVEDEALREAVEVVIGRADLQDLTGLGVPISKADKVRVCAQSMTFCFAVSPASLFPLGRPALLSEGMMHRDCPRPVGAHYEDMPCCWRAEGCKWPSSVMGGRHLTLELHQFRNLHAADPPGPGE